MSREKLNEVAGTVCVLNVTAVFLILTYGIPIVALIGVVKVITLWVAAFHSHGPLGKPLKVTGLFFAGWVVLGVFRSLACGAIASWYSARSLREMAQAFDTPEVEDPFQTAAREVARAHDNEEE